MDIKIKSSKGTEYTYSQNDIIGSGYYGCVYKAHDSSQNHDVAIKVINNIPIKNRRKGSLNGSEKEVHILQSLDPTPHALSLLGTAKDKKYVYIITEYCEGGTLRNILANSSEGFLDEKTAVRFLYEIAKGLDILQSRGIMHRDLNLDNIYLRKGCCVIGDFGSATTNLNSETACVGTPEYRAPEIFLATSKKTYNKQADLWSLGIIFHEMLFGKKPYEGDSIQESERKVLEGEYKIPETAIQISKEAKDLLKKLLVSNPSKRITLQQVFQHQIFANFQINSSQDQQPLFLDQKIMNHNTIQLTQFYQLRKQSTDFKPDQVVWAKIKGFSWWPAVINYAIVYDSESGAVKKNYMVIFLGTHQAGKVQASNIADFTEKYEEYKTTKSKCMKEAIEMALKLKSGQMTRDGIPMILSCVNLSTEAIEIAAKKASLKKEKMPQKTNSKRALAGPTNAKFNIIKTVKIAHDLQNHSQNIGRFNHDHLHSSEPMKKIKTEFSEDVFVRKHDPAQKVYDYQEFKEDLEFKFIPPLIIDDPSLEEEKDQDSVGSLVLNPTLEKIRNRLEMLIDDFVYEPRPLRCFKVHFVFLERILEEIQEIQPGAASLLHSEILQKIAYIEKFLAKLTQDQEIEKLSILDTIKDFKSHYQQEIIKQAFNASKLEQKYDRIIKDFTT